MKCLRKMWNEKTGLVDALKRGDYDSLMNYTQLNRTARLWCVSTYQ